MGDGLRVGGPINEKNRGELGLTQELETFQAYFWGDTPGADAAGCTVLSRLALGPAGVLPLPTFWFSLCLWAGCLHRRRVCRSSLRGTHRGEQSGLSLKALTCHTGSQCQPLVSLRTSTQTPEENQSSLWAAGGACGLWPCVQLSTSQHAHSFTHWHTDFVLVDMANGSPFAGNCHIGSTCPHRGPGSQSPRGSVVRDILGNLPRPFPLQ